MDDISTKEEEGKWNISARRIQKLCGEARIPEGVALASWEIPPKRRETS